MPSAGGPLGPDRTFPVWAPHATAVDVVVDGHGTHPLSPVRDAPEGHQGWWSLPAPFDAGPDPVDYGFVVDGDGPHSDPRSLRQPEGVHGLTREFDPRAHAWSDGGWSGRDLTGAVIYELHIGTFTPEGTLDSAIDRLDHLVELGVDAVEVLPVNAFNGTHNWGYDGVLWYAVQETYGGPEAYQRFVDACHARGLAVVQDVVYNHLGPSGNYLPLYGPYLGSASSTWGASLNLDGPHSDVVRGYILDNARYWLEDMHVDGLRLDAVHALHDSSAEHILEALARQADELASALGRPLTLIAESDLNDPKLIRTRERNGYGLHAQWDDDVHHSIHANLTGEVTGYYADFGAPEALVKVLERGFFHDGTYSSFRERHHGRPLDADFPHTRLVAFSQDHDQIGNRAAGDRLTATLDQGGLAAAAALTLLGPFTPMLFMGEEWGATTPWQFFTSHPEPELGKATAEGRVKEFEKMGWDPDVVPDPQDPETFLRSKLDWSEPSRPEHAELLQWYRDLIALRRTIPALTPATEVGVAEGVLAFTRGDVRVEVALSGRGLGEPAPATEVTAAFADAVRVTRV
ncbi:malto-oligosyltrehalose trehalohydrolase [Leifsonia sp. F6_8S_P_1B]|uniref:Malto-oligosyltrehalose trehalohydrolase n=1 Tax=Leifsonia williamsii TaxID=3035919 RepID=A0ABT8KAS9_9MICO|nr:malto-oligosyltrehalose trehalohydrolase [Leifsonia williamsii]MDN4613936.1 malto-oligosyltrehalose trehalohydrolase [Leifsonia williamsii]